MCYDTTMTVFFVCLFVCFLFVFEVCCTGCRDVPDEFVVLTVFAHVSITNPDLDA